VEGVGADGLQALHVQEQRGHEVNRISK
jgi:hypothetical protein